jgi:hypothetical protein
MASLLYTQGKQHRYPQPQRLLDPRTHFGQFEEEKSLATTTTPAHSLVIIPTELPQLLVNFRENFNSETLLLFSEQEVEYAPGPVRIQHSDNNLSMTLPVTQALY